MKSIKTILHKLADEFDSNATAANQSDISHTWGFAASELRLAAAQLPEDLHVTPISPANIAEGAINLYREYLDRYIADLPGDDIDELQERAQAAAILDTIEGVEADVIVPEDIPCVDPTRKDWHPTYVHEEDDPF